MRTIITDFIQNNPAEKVGVWLSEETVDDLKDEMARLDHGEYEALMSSIVATSEMVGMPRGSTVALKNNFEAFVKDQGLSLLIYDNPTTSAMYSSLNPSQQDMMQGWLKELCIECGIPFFFFLHTKDGVYDNQPKLIDLSDVRGTKGIANIAQYFYVSQRFEIGGLYYPTLRIRKYRGYTLEDRLYYLNYDKDTSTFNKDWPLPWDEFMEAFKRRNKLQ